VAAWIAVHPQSLGLPALLLMIAVTCWIGGFDIIYSCQDIEIDRRDGLHSLPSRVGPRRALWIARIGHAIAVAALIALGFVARLGAIYGAGVAAVAILLIVENSLVRAGDYRHVNLAFFTLNGVVSLVLASAAIADVLTRG
jgi:4-hydroxybenzoate polyprenyltransferase